MRGLLFSIVLAFSGFLSQPNAGAEQTGPALSIGLSTTNWITGSLPKGGVADTWYESPGTFAVTNTGTVAIQLLVTTSNVTPSGWVLSPVIGSNRYQLAISIEDGGPVPNYEPIPSEGLALSNTLDTNEVLQFDLRFVGPVDTPDVNMEQDIPISIIAIPLE